MKVNLSCGSCGTLNFAGSLFCQKCGSKLTADGKPEKKGGLPKEVTKSQPKTNLWDKFAELYDSTGERRERYLDSTTNDAWEFLQRVSTNIFEKFIEDNKEDLNKQPYRLIESLKNSYSWSIAGGYWIWLSEQVYNNDKIKPIKTYDIEKLGKEWEKLAFDDYSKTYTDISLEVKDGMNRFLTYRLNSFLDSVPSAKDLTKEFVDKLQTSLVYCVIWGYIFGLAESKYRN